MLLLGLKVKLWTNSNLVNMVTGESVQLNFINVYQDVLDFITLHFATASLLPHIKYNMFLLWSVGVGVSVLLHYVLHFFFVMFNHNLFLLLSLLHYIKYMNAL